MNCIKKKYERLTSDGHVKIFSPPIVSIAGSSNAHSLAWGIIADTEELKCHMQCQNEIENSKFFML